MADETPKASKFRRFLAHNARVIYTAVVASIAASVASIAATTAVYHEAKREGVELPPANVPPVVVVMQDAPPPALEMGWVDDPEAVRAVAATLPIQGFRDTPAGQVVEVRDHVYFWDAPRKVLGRDIPARNQGSIGSCVAHGAETAAEYLLAMQVASGLGGEFKDISPEVIYGGSRVQIGKGQVRGDGSLGVWAAKWCSEYGLVPKGKHGAIDLTEYSVERCRDYGNRGCPAELVPVAKKSPVRSVAPIRTPEECRKALDSNYPVTIASSVGFGPTGGNVRDADGFLLPRGTWAHQMVIIGYQTGRRPGFFIMNSWGPDWVSGPKGAGDPPEGGFWADESAVARILAQNDSWAFSDAAGFPRRKLDWFIRHFHRPDPFALRGVSWLSA